MADPSKVDSWGRACVLAAVVAASGGLMVFLPATIKAYQWAWLVKVGVILQLPAFVVVSVSTFIVPGGFHNHDYFYRITPLVTWILYAPAIHWLLSRRRGKNG